MLSNILLFVPDMEHFVVWNRFMYCYVGLIVALSVWKIIENALDNG